jgi:hypothetical protein
LGQYVRDDAPTTVDGVRVKCNTPPTTTYTTLHPSHHHSPSCITIHHLAPKTPPFTIIHHHTPPCTQDTTIPHHTSPYTTLHPRHHHSPSYITIHHLAPNKPPYTTMITQYRLIDLSGPGWQCWCRDCVDRDRKLRHW